MSYNLFVQTAHNTPSTGTNKRTDPCTDIGINKTPYPGKAKKKKGRIQFIFGVIGLQICLLRLGTGEIIFFIVL